MKRKNFILNSMLACCILYHSYILGLAGLDRISDINKPKINSQSQLEMLLKEEKEKLKCSKEIIAMLCDNMESSFSGKSEDGSYIIMLGKNATISALKHELYHIHDGHTEVKPTFLRYHFWGEPQATLYASFGIRL